MLYNSLLKHFSKNSDNNFIANNDSDFNSLKELGLAQKIEKYETFYKTQWGLEKYQNVLDQHKEILKKIHSALIEKINPQADFYYASEWICNDTDADLELSELQKTYTKGLFVLAGFYLQSENKA
jgi:hypothetical protein